MRYVTPITIPGQSQWPAVPMGTVSDVALKAASLVAVVGALSCLHDNRVRGHGTLDDNLMQLLFWQAEELANEVSELLQDVCCGGITEVSNGAH